MVRESGDGENNDSDGKSESCGHQFKTKIKRPKQCPKPEHPIATWFDDHMDKGLI